MGKAVGIGIVGTGFARRVQIPAFLLCENAKIVSVASGSLGNARSCAEEFGLGHFTSDWRETVMFGSYAERGDAFAEAVRRLTSGSGAAERA